MAHSKEDLEYMCRKLQEEYSKWGLTMNIAKTKYMSSGTDTNYLKLKVPQHFTVLQGAIAFLKYFQCSMF
jgi:hypothetical protein